MANKISVIVPVFRVEKYFKKCLDSLVNQTHHNLEIILVNDGSDDGCPAICDKYAKKYVNIKVLHKQNGGLSDARNAGLELATGDYISFVDSDDYIPRNYFQLMMECAITNNSDIVTVLPKNFDAELLQYDKNDNCEQISIEVYSKKEALDIFFLKPYYNGKPFQVVAWGKLYKKHLFKDIRFPLGRLHEDVAIAYRLYFAAQRLAHIKGVYYYYNQREGSIMKSQSAVNYFSHYKNYEEMIDFLENHSTDNNEIVPSEYSIIPREKIIQFALFATRDFYKKNQEELISQSSRVIKKYADYRTRKKLSRRMRLALFLYRINKKLFVWFARRDKNTTK